MIFRGIRNSFEIRTRGLDSKYKHLYFFSLYDDDDIWKVWVSGRQQKMSLTPSVVREIIQGKTFRNDILGTTTTWIVVKEHKNKTNIIAAQGISLSLNSPLSSHLLSSFHFYDWQCGIYFLHITVKWDITYKFKCDVIGNIRVHFSPELPKWNCTWLYLSTIVVQDQDWRDYSTSR